MMNPQVRYGEDVMSRITYCMLNEAAGLKELQDTIIEGLNTIAKQAAEKAGFQTFTKTGCGSCHNGPLVGGNIFQKLGITSPWPDDTDMGVFMVSNNPADKMMFKVPTLRNIALTAPYFHTGQAWDLRQAVAVMGTSQLGTQLSDDEINKITAFLDSLTGEQPRVSYPMLPPSVATTPRPQP